MIEDKESVPGAGSAELYSFRPEILERWGEEILVKTARKLEEEFSHHFKGNRPGAAAQELDATWRALFGEPYGTPEQQDVINQAVIDFYQEHIKSLVRDFDAEKAADYVALFLMRTGQNLFRDDAEKARVLDLLARQYYKVDPQRLAELNDAGWINANVERAAKHSLLNGGEVLLSPSEIQQLVGLGVAGIKGEVEKDGLILPKHILWLELLQKAQPLDEASLSEVRQSLAETEPNKLFAKSMEHVDEAAITAIQNKLAARVDIRLAELLKNRPDETWLRRIFGDHSEIRSWEDLIAAAERAKQRVLSSEFREKLMSWEPWRLDDKSVKEGTNLHVRMAKAHADPEFLEWLARRSKQAGVSENELLAGIIESTRRIEWEVTKYLLANGETNQTRLPLTIFHLGPMRSAEAIRNSLHRSRRAGRVGINKEPGYVNPLFDKEKALEGGLFIWGPEDGEYDSEEIIGPISGAILGAGGNNLVSLNSKTVKETFDGLFDELYPSGTEQYVYGFHPSSFRIIVVEEALHSYDFKGRDIRRESASNFQRDFSNRIPIYAQHSIEHSVPSHHSLNELAKSLGRYLDETKAQELIQPLLDRLGQ